MILFDMPAAKPVERMLVGFRVPTLAADHLAAALKGFRPGAVSAERALSFARRSPVNRVTFERCDRAFLVRRGGGDLELRQKRVAVIGCGAVGGRVAELLAMIGVGEIRLLDDETLATANAHKHILGLADIGRRKVEALRALLLRRFPAAVIKV
jgi:hypothetical protein